MFIPAFISLTPKDDDLIADATNKHGIAPTHVSLSLFCLPVFPMYGYVFIGRKCSHQHYENKSAPHEALSRLHTHTVCTVRKERGDLKLVPMKIRRQ